VHGHQSSTSLLPEVRYDATIIITIIIIIIIMNHV
jgi:hypothetical protein